MAPLMIYGATGYTGHLICEQVKKAGVDFTIAGRSEAKLQTLAATLDVAHQAFTLDTPSIYQYLRAPTVLLNCAGPFAQTAHVLMDACVRSRTHYLDVSAELDSYLVAREMSKVAEEAGIMLLPGCGGSVAMLGCLAAHATRGAVKPVSVDIALHVAGSMSRGSATSAADSANAGCLRMMDDQLVQQDTSDRVQFDFGDGRGSVSCFAATLPDLITLQESTGCDNIQTFVHVSGDAFPDANTTSLSDGPTLEERKKSPYHAAVSVRDIDGSDEGAVLHTVNGYTFTAVASVEAARRVLAGEVKAGWQTPVGLYGARFIDAVPDTTIIGRRKT